MQPGGGALAYTSESLRSELDAILIADVETRETQ